MNRKKAVLTIVVALAISGSAFLGITFLRRAIAVDIVKYFPFSKENSLREWKEKVFNGRVVYRIDNIDHESFVLATSDGTSSAMYYKVKLDLDRRPFISWRWNAKRFPDKGGMEDLSKIKHNDFAARVYVIFPAAFFTRSRAIEYLWTESIPKGTIMASPYSKKNLRMIVLRSGTDDVQGWVSEKRDIYEDYLEAFGEEPRYDVGAIAFMTDADSMHTTAEAFYDDIRIGYKKIEPEESGE